MLVLVEKRHFPNSQVAASEFTFEIQHFDASHRDETLESIF
jgi:hypothetical protein